MSKPSVARMYDYLLGGIDHYASDREACRQLLEIAPNTEQLAQANRDFLVRAVNFLAAEAAIEQYLDHGSGLPTQDNVHQVAQRHRDTARVVYVDNDPIVAGHGRMMLETNQQTTVVEADMRDDLLAREDVADLILPDEPTAALFVSVLHCLPDEDDPLGLVRRLVARLPSGSYVVISHLTSDDEALRDEISGLMTELTGRWGRVRSPAEVARFFDGLEVVDELCEVSRWRPHRNRGRQVLASHEWVEFGGVARIP